MNRKKKINDLYKGVFKNDKKGCLVDLKPLDDRRDQNNHPNINSNQVNVNQINISKQQVISKNNNNHQHQGKLINVSLKVAKNLGFGSYFQNLREDILEVFFAKEDLISFEKMFNHKDVSDLFNFKESVTKSDKNTEGSTASFHNNNNPTRSNYIPSNNTGFPSKNNFFQDFNENNETFAKEEIILYEDEDKTIYKRKKLRSKMDKDIDHMQGQGQAVKMRYQNNNTIPIANVPLGSCSNDSYYYCQNQTNTNNTNPNSFFPMNENNNRNQSLYTPDKGTMNIGNNYTKNSVLFMNKINNCRNHNGKYASNINYI